MRILPETTWTLTDLFLARTRTSPEGLAYRWFEGGRWVDLTWGEALTAVGRWRAALERENLVPGDRVGLCSRNRVEWMCLDQAALSLGLVVVPLFYNDRPDNMAYCLNDAGAKFLLLEDGTVWEAMRAHPTQQRPVVDVVIAQERHVQPAHATGVPPARAAGRAGPSGVSSRTS